jgi:hypothetical protein
MDALVPKDGRGRRPGGRAGRPKAALQLVRRETRSAKLRASLGRRPLAAEVRPQAAPLG